MGGAPTRVSYNPSTMIEDRLESMVFGGPPLGAQRLVVQVAVANSAEVEAA